MFGQQLSASEQKVYDYVKSEAERNGGSFTESMKTMGDKLGVSESTVHRAIRKMSKAGLVSLIPSPEKTKPSEIVYYGDREEDQQEQVDKIFMIASDLNNNMTRLKALMDAKDHVIRTMEEERTKLINQLNNQQKEIENLRETNTQLRKWIAFFEKSEAGSILRNSEIVGITNINDTTKALIFKVKKKEQKEG